MSHFVKSSLSHKASNKLYISMQFESEDGEEGPEQVDYVVVAPLLDQYMRGVVESIINPEIK